MSDPQKPASSRIVMAQRRSNVISGKWSALVMILSLVVAGVLVAKILKFPAWVEFEIALGAYWIIWMGALTAILFRGHSVSDDVKAPDFGSRTKRSADGSADAGGCVLEGCLHLPDLEVIAILLAVIAVIVAIFFLVELVLPAIAFLLYLGVRGMIAHAVNDRHHCKGRLLLAAGWGAFWSTIYVGPFSLVVWAVHHFAVKR